MKLISLVVMAVSVLTVCSTTAFAEFVKFYANEKNGNTHLIDVNSIHSKDGKKIALCRRSFGDPRSYGGYSTVELKVSADCKKNKLAALQMVAYNKAGEIQYTDTIITDLPLDPGTPNFLALKIICGQKTPKQTIKDSGAIQSKRFK